MKSKNILLAGIAAGALAAAAGGASALNLSGSSIGGQQVVSNTGVVTPYLIANEAKIPVGGLTGPAFLDVHLQTGPVTSGTFLVSYTISGGTFDVSGVTGASLTYGGSSSGTSATVSTSNSTQVSFVVTLGAGNSITDFDLAIPVKMASIQPVSFLAAVTVPSAGGAPIDNSPTANTVLIQGTQAFSATIGANPAQDNKATIGSNFTLFQSPPGCGGVAICPTSATTSLIGSVMATANTNANRDLVGDKVANTDVTAVAITIPASSLGATETISVGPSQSPNGVTTVPSFATNAGVSQPVVLTQTAAAGSRAPLAASGYSVTVTDQVDATKYNQASVLPATVAEGGISYEGVTFNAAWVGDGNNGFNYVIRIANYAGGQVSQVSVLLKDPLNTGTSGSVGAGAPCTVASSIPAFTEKLIQSADLRACFGNFGRSDLIINVQGSANSLSAKMRVVGAGSTIATEQSLGFGATVAQQP